MAGLTSLLQALHKLVQRRAFADALLLGVGVLRPLLARLYADFSTGSASVRAAGRDFLEKRRGWLGQHAIVVRSVVARTGQHAAPLSLHFLLRTLEHGLRSLRDPTAVTFAGRAFSSVVKGPLTGDLAAITEGLFSGGELTLQQALRATAANSIPPRHRDFPSACFCFSPRRISPPDETSPKLLLPHTAQLSDVSFETHLIDREGVVSSVGHQHPTTTGVHGYPATGIKRLRKARRDRRDLLYNLQGGHEERIVRVLQTVEGLQDTILVEPIHQNRGRELVHNIAHIQGRVKLKVPGRGRCSE